MILVAGEALVDLVATADGAITAHPGGAPFTVCRTIARLGRPTAFLGALSDDRFGQTLRAGLADEGVELCAAVAVSRPTTLALAEIDGVGGASYRFYGEGTSAPAVPPEAAAAALRLAPSALHVGTLGLVFEPLAAASLALVDGAGADVLVLVDPNCRPTVTAERDRYDATVARCARRADVIKVSDEDLAFLAPGEDPVGAVRALLAPGAVGLLSRGAEGVTVVTAGCAVDVAAPRVTVVDTVGAGDGLGGAFLADWDAHGRGRAELADLELVVGAVRFAVAVASMMCERAGADPPYLHEAAAWAAAHAGAARA